MTSHDASQALPAHETHAVSNSTGTQLENIPVNIFDEPATMSYRVAKRIANLIEERRAVGKNLVLGLPTGSTPIGVYQNLIRFHQEKGLDFSNVVTFNLDEYFPINPDSLQSYVRFMRENFFDHVNIPESNIHIPRGDIAREEVEIAALRYENDIQKAGGIDLLLLGIGRSGHIGFNEPGSNEATRTRMITLDEITRKDAASDFFGEENVPREAITMGVGTILEAHEIILMATGEHKARIIRDAVEGEVSRRITASYLQRHRNAAVYVDDAAASELTRIKTPWKVGEVDWTFDIAKRAIIWLSQNVGKAILRLERADFYAHSLYGLAAQHPDLDALCHRVFDDLRKRITYRDGLPKNSRVICFSPHPDDDVISMGGILDKLVQNGNEVLVAYMTNGSVAVFDADVRRYLQFFEMSLPALHADEETTRELRDRAERIYDFLDSKAPGAVDLDEVQQVKSYIRYSEAIAGIEVMGLNRSHARFLDMPFYKTGRVRKDPISQADVDIVLDLMNEVHPDNIYVAGDLSDPHGTHRMCYFAIREALEQYNAQEEIAAPGEDPGPADEATYPAPHVWLYRGAWQEWEVDRADVFMPMSKADLDRKIEAIFKHESQKDRAMFPGAHDAREFWERARDRNTQTAEQLNALGLPEFYAAEAYVTGYDL